MIFSFSKVDQLVIGDEVLVKEINEVNPAKVINVSSHTMQGNFETSVECGIFLSKSYTHSDVNLEKNNMDLSSHHHIFWRYLLIEGYSMYLPKSCH